jgi:hypothetical protein
MLTQEVTEKYSINSTNYMPRIGCVVIRDFKVNDKSSLLLLYHIRNMIQISNFLDGSNLKQMKALQETVGLK